MAEADRDPLPRPRRGPDRALLFAVAVSALVHLAIVSGVPVRVPAGSAATGTALRATLASADADTDPKDAVSTDSPTVVAAPARPQPIPIPTPSPAVEPEPPAPPVPPAAIAPVSAGPAPVEGPPGLEMPQIADPEFYPSRLLDVYPKPMADVPLSYPAGAESSDTSGTVTLLLLIDELGMVVEATVVEADPPGHFEQAAIDAFRNVLFAPGQRHGRPVKSRLVVEVSFQAQADSQRAP
ncbi:MAG: TonB family protein [Burkholderiales bacterium]|nr:TonB family protein [Burkholderiales bacterium]